MTRADVVETRRANGYAVRISQKVKDMLHGRYRLTVLLFLFEKIYIDPCILTLRLAVSAGRVSVGYKL